MKHGRRSENTASQGKLANEELIRDDYNRSAIARHGATYRESCGVAVCESAIAKSWFRNGKIELALLLVGIQISQ